MKSASSVGEDAAARAHSTLRARVNLAFGLAAFILAVTGVVSVRSILLSREAAQRRRESFVRSAEISRVLSGLQDAETGQRGYLLTGDLGFLEPNERAVDSMQVQLARVRAVVATDSAQARRFAAVEGVISEKMGELARTIELRRTGSGPDAIRMVASGRGKALMDLVRLRVAEMLEAERASLQFWDDRLRASDRVSLVTTVAASLFALVFLGLAVLLINRDLANTARTATALRESESRLFQILEALPIAVFAVDDSGRSYYANQASQAILGRGIVPGTGIQELPEVYQTYRAGTDEPYPADRLPVARALSGETAHVTDIETRRPDRTVPMEVWAAPVYDSSGRVALAIAAFSDVTERKEAEEGLHKAIAAAEEANRAKSDFLAKMSHELRTPLNSIIGFSEVLQDESFGSLNDKQKRYVANVLTSGRSLLDLINHILDLSRVEAGRMELAWSEFPIGDALAEVRTIVSTLADKKRLILELEVADGLPPLVADQSKVKQIMYNLLSNAIKFTPEGGRVRVVARQPTHPQGEADIATIEIAVSDTGIGIPPEDQQRIFGEFEQVDSAYGRGQKGTGLGLALTQKLVELHGGRIWVESTPGTGSTFAFTLPVGQGHPVTPPRTFEPITPLLPALPRAVSQRVGSLVLIVEDERQARDLLTHYLTEAGHRVATATTGEDAITLARELRPDVITLDILLPGRDGHEVLAQLKAAPETRDIPVVVVSITENRDLGLSLGAADWFVKPARREDFVGAIRRALGNGPILSTATVLVVDDEPATLEFLSDVLTVQGFRVLTAGDGRKGIALALAHKPDVVVLDLVMPEVTGFDVARELSQHSQTRDIPILVFSVKDLTAEEREQLKGSVKAIIMKGQGREHLLQELARVTTKE